MYLRQAERNNDKRNGTKAFKLKTTKGKRGVKEHHH